MKHNIIITLFTVLFIPVFAVAQTPKVQGTIIDMAGNSLPNVARVSGKTDVAIVNRTFDNINVTISISDMGASNPTEAQISKSISIPNLELIAYASNPWVDGGRAYYSYVLTDNNNNIPTSWSINTSNPIIEFTFPSAVSTYGMRLDDVSPFGGPNAQMYWYVQITALGDVTNFAEMFYGTGAVNNGGSSPSYVPLQSLGTSITDHFRTITSGDWNALTTWESSPVADFSSGVVSPATLTPDNNSNTINIRNSHTVTVTANVTTDQTFVNPGGALVVNGSTLTVVNNGLTVQSTSAGTGRIGSSTGTITGNVTVERFIADAGKRAWRLLSGKSVGGSQTIYDSWQEGGSLDAGKGTWITSTQYNGSNGFDATNANLSSIITHVQGGGAGPSWNYSLANTNATALSANQAYMLFVRGDRTYQASTPGRSATTLRATGPLNQGNQPAVTVSSTGSGYTLLGNPFASPIDLENILTTTNLSQFFYVWDATQTGIFGVGGFRLVQKTGAGTYTTTPSSGNDNSLRYIHSGQGFFLKASGSDASVVITEAHKASSLSVVNPFNPVAGDQQLYTELAVVEPGNAESVVDGVRIWYNNNFSAGTADDIDKIGNFGENISSFRNNKKWVVELRPMISGRDTIFLRTSNLAIRNYRLKINTIDFVQTGLQAFVKDNWQNALMPINLNGAVNNFDFSVTADPVSAAPDRFMILFAANGPLPVTFISVTAQKQNNDIAVEWKVSNQLNIDRYEVEKSMDGVQFGKVETQQAVITNTGTVTYSWLDVNPAAGDHFYRIRSIGSNGDIKISQVVKVTIGKGKPAITVYPNPVVGKTTSIAFRNLDQGKYQLRLVNAQGQLVESRQVVHGGGSAAYPLVFTSNPAAGTYMLEIVYPDRNKTSVPLVLTN